MASIIHNIVKRLSKRQWKIISNDDIKNIVIKIQDKDPSNSRIHKISYTLRNKWYLISLKKNCFLVTNPNENLDENIITINYYRELLRNHCKIYLDWPWYIWWLKALELHLHNYDIPDTIEIVNTYKNSLELILFDKRALFKQYTHRYNDIFKQIKKHLIRQKIGKYTFSVASLELAMLESLHNPSAIQRPLIDEYIKKILRKNKKTLDFDFFEMILTFSKHHVWVNRIYQLSKAIDPDLADKFYKILMKCSFIIKED